MELPFWTPLLAPSPSSKRKKTFGVVPRSRAHIMEASDCVFELFGWRTVTRPVAKNRLPYFVPKTPGYTLYCQLAKKKEACVNERLETNIPNHVWQFQVQIHKTQRGVTNIRKCLGQVEVDRYAPRTTKVLM